MSIPAKNVSIHLFIQFPHSLSPYIDPTVAPVSTVVHGASQSTTSAGGDGGGGVKDAAMKDRRDPKGGKTRPVENKKNLNAGTSAEPTDRSTDLKDGELSYDEPSLPRRSRQRKLPNGQHYDMMHVVLLVSIILPILMMVIYE